MEQTLYEIWEKHGDGFCVLRQHKGGWEVWLGLVPSRHYQNRLGETVYTTERSFEGERWTAVGGFGRGKVYESEASEENWEHYKGSKTIDHKTGRCECCGEGWVNIAHPVRPGVIAWRLPCNSCNEKGVYPDPWPPPIFTVTTTKGP
jgi:hypothetical protein